MLSRRRWGLSHPRVSFDSCRDMQPCSLTQGPIVLLRVSGGTKAGLQRDGLAFVAICAQGFQQHGEGWVVFVYSLAGTLPLTAIPNPARLSDGRFWDWAGSSAFRRHLSPGQGLRALQETGAGGRGHATWMEGRSPHSANRPSVPHAASPVPFGWAPRFLDRAAVPSPGFMAGIQRPVRIVLADGRDFHFLGSKRETHVLVQRDQSTPARAGETLECVRRWHVWPETASLSCQKRWPRRLSLAGKLCSIPLPSSRRIGSARGFLNAATPPLAGEPWLFLQHAQPANLPAWPDRSTPINVSSDMYLPSV